MTYFNHIIENNFDPQKIYDAGYYYHGRGMSEADTNPTYSIVTGIKTELLREEFEALDKNTQYKLFEYLCRNAHNSDTTGYSRNLLPALNVSKEFLEDFYTKAKNENMVIKSSGPGHLFADMAYYMSSSSKEKLMSIVDSQLTKEELFGLLEGVYSHATARMGFSTGYSINVAPEAKHYFKKLINNGHSRELYEKLMSEGETGEEKIQATLHDLRTHNENEVINKFTKDVPEIKFKQSTVNGDQDLDACIKRIEDKTKEYLDWMKDNTQGYRGFTRFKHMFHGASGEERAKSILDIISSSKNTNAEKLHAVSVALNESGTANHSYSRYLYDAILQPAQSMVDNKGVNFSKEEKVELIDRITDLVEKEDLSAGKASFK